MTEQKRKRLYWLFKVLGVVVSCAFPIAAILEKFPIWTEAHGAEYSIGAGGVLILIVLLIIFRKSVFGFMKDRLNLKHAPPIVVWIVMLIVAYTLLFINSFIEDMTTIFWMGLVGCAIGTVLTYIAESRYRKKDSDG
jgi:membrane protease YdiL (CAAX protease family)